MRNLAVAAAALMMSGSAVWAQDTEYALEDVIFLSCEEAWAESGESVDNAIGMIRVMTEFSLSKRGLEVEKGDDDLAAQYGSLIKAMCTADPQDLLFNAVDKSIRRLAN